MPDLYTIRINVLMDVLLIAEQYQANGMMIHVKIQCNHGGSKRRIKDKVAMNQFLLFMP